MMSHVKNSHKLRKHNKGIRMRTFRAIGYTSCIGGVAGLYSKMPYETKSGCFEYTATKVKPDYKIIHFIRHAEGVHNVAGEQGRILHFDFTLPFHL